MARRKNRDPERMKAAIEAVRNKEMGSYKARRVFIICFPTHSSHKMQHLDKAFIGPPENILLPRYWKMAPLNPRTSRHRLPNWRNVRKRIQGSCNRRDSANGFRATSLFSCDRNTFRPQDFLLASGNTDAAPVNLPALEKTSDQLSFSFSNFSPFTPVEVLGALDISRVPNLNLKPNLRGGTAWK